MINKHPFTIIANQVDKHTPFMESPVSFVVVKRRGNPSLFLLQAIVELIKLTKNIYVREEDVVFEMDNPTASTVAQIGHRGFACTPYVTFRDECKELVPAIVLGFTFNGRFNLHTNTKSLSWKKEVHHKEDHYHSCIVSVPGENMEQPVDEGCMTVEDIAKLVHTYIN